jgi:hypothetical protein
MSGDHHSSVKKAMQDQAEGLELASNIKISNLVIHQKVSKRNAAKLRFDSHAQQVNTNDDSSALISSKGHI